MLRVAICDDERSCRNRLYSALMNYSARTGVEFEIITFEDGDRLLLNYPKDLDLLFLDIAMTGIDGMTAAKEIRKFDPNVCIIFITTMYQYAIDGYSVRAFGFIKKPVSEAELQHELKCALTQIENNKAREQFITIKSSGMLRRIPISRISYCEVKNHQIYIFADGENYQYRESMSVLEEKLKPLGFFRCHSSFIVNGEHIARIEQAQLILSDGSVIPISQRKRKEFMQEMSEYIGGTI